MPASHFDVKPMTGRPKFVRHSTTAQRIKRQVFAEILAELERRSDILKSLCQEVAK
jgi:hypothetical protein